MRKNILPTHRKNGNIFRLLGGDRLPSSFERRMMNRRIMVRSILPAAPPGRPFGRFRSFQRKSRKNGFFGRLEAQNCQKEDFWRITRAFIIQAPLRNGFIVRFQQDGVCPGKFSVEENVEKFMLIAIDLNPHVGHPNLNLNEK